MAGKPTQRVGDSNSGGGKIVKGVNSVRVNGKPISVLGNPVACHNPCGQPGGSPHCNAKTKNTQKTVRAGGKPVIKTGDTDTCGHGRVGGSPNVFVGG